MILYHGSQQIVESPKFGIGKVENDYGQGFYCTESLDLAKEWACPIERDGYANSYDFDLTELSILNLNSDEYTILNWLALLLNYRQIDLNRNKEVGIQGKQYLIDNFTPAIVGYDVIKGYRADDRYFAFARDFVQNEISVRQLALAMKLGDLGEQVVLKSEKAFSNIHFIGYEMADNGIYYKNRRLREQEAGSNYKVLSENTKLSISDLYMIDILRGEIKNNDPRLR